MDSVKATLINHMMTAYTILFMKCWCRVSGMWHYCNSSANSSL